MPFLYSLVLIATLFTSLQAMEPEAIVQAAQKTITAEQAAALAQQAQLKKAAEHVKKASAEEAVQRAQKIVDDANREKASQSHAEYLKSLEQEFYAALKGEQEEFLNKEFATYQNPETIQFWLKETKIKPTAQHLETIVGSSYQEPDTPIMVNQLLHAGAPISAKALELALASDDKDSLRTFAILLEGGGYQVIYKNPRLLQIFKDANNTLRYGTLNAEEKQLLSEKLKLYESVKKRTETRIAQKPKSNIEPNSPSLTPKIPPELIQHILAQLGSGDSLPEISQAIASARRTNKTFKQLLDDETFTKFLIDYIAQRAALKYISSLPSSTEIPFKKASASILAAATIHTPTAQQWLSKYLLDNRGLELTAQDTLGYAAMGNHLAAMDSLLKARVNPNRLISHTNDTPLTAAIRNHSLSAITMLLKARAQPNLQALRSYPLEVAINVGASSDIVKALITAGADPRKTHGFSLLSALDQGPKTDIETIKALLNAGQKINTIFEIGKSRIKKTALDVALEKSASPGINPEIITLLKQRGAKRAVELTGK